ncbi:hypothetical protein [Amycolatopsis minnesotensis]|uniref:Secreted protein n=1 Tax=Amycolatopsis minnesotensis TaxID=337894 RepID=A0ABP5DNX7_9PSEU
MRSRRRFGRALTAFTAGVGGVALAAGAAAGASPPSKPSTDSVRHQVVAKTEYDCGTGEGAVAQKLPVEITATLPNFVEQGKPVKVDDLAFSFSLAHDAIPPSPAPTSTSGEPSTVVTARGSATADLGTTVAGKRTTTPLKLSIDDTPVNPAGTTTFTAKGGTAAAIGSATSTVLLDMGAPVITLGSGTAETTFTCTADAPTTLGSALVRTEDGRTPDNSKPATGKKTTPLAAGGTAETLSEPGYIYFGVEPFKIDGYSTVKKAKTRLKIDTVLVNNIFGSPLETGLPSKQTGDLRFSVMKANLLGFDFVPTSADVELLPPDYEGGNATVPAAVILYPGDITSHLEVFVRITNVKVNGVPLDVGPNCRTATPASIDLTTTIWDPVAGGILKTDPAAKDPRYRGFTLPAFTGCGRTEPLSPLISGLNSGPDNQACITGRGLSTPPDPSAPKC